MTFETLFKEFIDARTEFYEEMRGKIDGPKVHVPIPVKGSSSEYGLASLIHELLGGRYLGRPYTVLMVSDVGIGFVEYGEETESLAKWEGPLFDRDFEENEYRLLDISVPVFNSYASDSRNELVKEYAQRFAAITPPEFLFYYRQLNADFLEWLALEAVWKDSQ